METIKFEFLLSADFWDQPPIIDILIDENQQITKILELGNNTISFTHNCEFNKQHTLTIKRYGKDNSQTKILADSTLDQKLELVQLKIDGVNIKDIILTKSKTILEYPEPWATKQRIQGIVLEKEIFGNTVFGHNCIWQLNFTSPFYLFVMKSIND